MNYYEILQISEDASPEVIKAAYKALGKKYHPDCYLGDKQYAEKIMTQINVAYETLSDEKKRANYDFTIRHKKQTESNVNNASKDKKENEDFQKEETYKQTARDVDVPFGDSDNDKYAEEELGPFGKFFSSLGKHIINSMQENSREINNAFIDGMNMDEYILVRKFKQAKGNKRYGYAKALEERGLLERNPEGSLVPTYKYRKYL